MLLMEDRLASFRHATPDARPSGIGVVPHLSPHDSACSTPVAGSFAIDTRCGHPMNKSATAGSAPAEGIALLPDNRSRTAIPRGIETGPMATNSRRPVRARATPIGAAKSPIHEHRHAHAHSESDAASRSRSDSRRRHMPGDFRGRANGIGRNA